MLLEGLHLTKASYFVGGQRRTIRRHKGEQTCGKKEETYKNCNGRQNGAGFCQGVLSYGYTAVLWEGRKVKGQMEWMFGIDHGK